MYFAARFARRAGVFPSCLILLIAFGAAIDASRAERIACTEQALHAKIAALNANCSGDKTITFDCSNQTILIADDLNTVKVCRNGDPYDSACVSDSDCGSNGPCALNQHGCNNSGACTGNKLQRRITCDGVTIDGENNNITFELNPRCDARVGATGCTELENQAYIFRIEADNVTIRNLTISHFWEGIYSIGANNTIEDCSFVRPCDDAFTNWSQATGTVFQRNAISLGCDKCITLYGKPTPSYPNYNTQMIDNTFVDCREPIQTTQGRQLLDGNHFSCSGTGPWTCQYVSIESSAIAYMKDNTFDGHWYNVHVQNTASMVSLGGNVFSGASYHGFLVKDSGKAFLEGDTVTNNGTTYHTNPNKGGVIVEGSGNVDAGGGSLTIDGHLLSSAGNNSFYGNKEEGDPTSDFRNLTSSQAVIMARSNYWGDGNPSDQVDGNVDAGSPLASDPSDPGNDDGAPPAPAVWRTDTQ